MSTYITDGKNNVVFPVNPEVIKVAMTAEFGISSVLGSRAPVVAPKYTSTSHRIDRVLFYSKYGELNFTPRITQLQKWVDGQALLKFSSSTKRLDACHIRSLTIEAQRWSGTKILQAELSMELLEVSYTPKTTGNKLNLLPNVIKITKGEAERLARSLASFWRTTGVRSLAYGQSLELLDGFDPDSIPDFNVSTDGTVTVTQGDKVELYDYEAFTIELRAINRKLSR